MVEFALLLPLLITVVLLTIDFSRLVYTYAAISWAAREGARIVSLAPNIATDCSALQRVEDVGRGFPIQADPNSVVGNTDPNAPGTPGPTFPPPSGQGYVYIYPAVATANPPDTNCNGSPRILNPVTHDVAVQVTYGYTPIVPLFRGFIPNIPIRTICVVHVEY
jgi:hypothetical protein